MPGAVAELVLSDAPRLQQGEPLEGGAASPLRPLRVGVVSSYMSPHLGGLEVVAESVFQAYGAAGLEVRWVASRAPNTSASREYSRIRVQCWNGFERWPGVSWPVWGLEGIREVARLVQWADVLHVHECVYMSSALAVWLACRVGKPVLLSKHIGFVRYASPVLRTLEALLYRILGRQVLRGASHIVCCTLESEEQILALLGGRPAASSLILNGVDTTRFHMPDANERARARQELGLPASARIALFAGRLMEYKGVDLFLDVRARMSAHHFLLVGDGPCRPSQSENLTWIPFLSLDRMPLAYQAADVFLLMSNSEAAPLVMKEAMAAGVPVIAARGHRFLEQMGQAGACLVVDRTAAAFCDVLERLWQAPEGIAALTSRARELVVRHWGLQAIGARYLALVHELVEQHRSP